MDNYCIGYFGFGLINGFTIWKFELIKYHNIIWSSRIGWAFFVPDYSSAGLLRFVWVLLLHNLDIQYYNCKFKYRKANIQYVFKNHPLYLLRTNQPLQIRKIHLNFINSTHSIPAMTTKVFPTIISSPSLHFESSSDTINLKYEESALHSALCCSYCPRKENPILWSV